MRLWTGLVSPRVWPSLRRVLFAALALVLALAEEIDPAPGPGTANISTTVC